ncbi:MAG: hypothetical protein U1C46_07390 [Bacteroidales bacterium]|nr:hypothetical protein [Bacteroidales bacterium]MDZ4204627.1 hypothetical protein [Bacteroidales bacterium]
MFIFKDSQECKVDSKGRLLLPSIYRKGMGDAVSAGFILKKSIFTKSLELYAKERWDKELLKLQRLNRYNEKHQRVLRTILYGIRTVEIDSVGRILLPKDLLNFAEIEDDVMLSPAVAYLEIWNKKLFMKSIDDSIKTHPQDVEDVMGEIGIDPY